jgi:hypothetical protein
MLSPEIALSLPLEDIIAVHRVARESPQGTSGLVDDDVKSVSCTASDYSFWDVLEGEESFSDWMVFVYPPEEFFSPQPDPTYSPTGAIWLCYPTPVRFGPDQWGWRGSDWDTWSLWLEYRAPKYQPVYAPHFNPHEFLDVQKLHELTMAVIESLLHDPESRSPTQLPMELRHPLPVKKGNLFTWMYKGEAHSSIKMLEIFNKIHLLPYAMPGESQLRLMSLLDKFHSVMSSIWNDAYEERKFIRNCVDFAPWNWSKPPYEEVIHEDDLSVVHIYI